MKTLTRSNEINMIAYAIPDSNDIILDRSNDKYFVQTSDGVFIYSPDEMAEVYNINVNDSDLHRIGWVA